MTQTIETQYHPETVSPPRETLRELLEERGMSQAELAKRMGKTPKAVGEILSDKDDVAITPETALQLERSLGLAARFWLNRERAYREAEARRKEHEEHKRAIDWLDCLPLTELRKLGYITAPKKGPEAVMQALSFFRVFSVASWKLLWSRAEVDYRMSDAFASEVGHLAAWLRLGELHAESIQCDEYSPNAFESALRQARTLTTAPIGEIRSGLTHLCARAGVALVFVPEFRKTHVCGAARWINGGRRPIIYLSLRYKTDDHFWFSFFHEACHILRHGKKLIFVDDKHPSGAQVEEEANRFSRNFLIPPDAYSEFTRSRDRFTKNNVAAFSRSVGIAPGIVVGHLQHDGLLGRGFLNGLKRRFDFDGLDVIEAGTRAA